MTRSVRYYVHGGNALGYVVEGQGDTLGVLAGDIFRGGPDPKNGPIAITDELVPATREDFARFRVSTEGHLP